MRSGPRGKVVCYFSQVYEPELLLPNLNHISLSWYEFNVATQHELSFLEIFSANLLTGI